MTPTVPKAVFDDQRLAALDRYKILDTSAEPAFDDIVLLAKDICAAPIALVSLVSSERQWFKAKCGIDASQTPITQSVCAYVVEGRELLVIPDLTEDARTKANTLVTQAPHIRFYAGAPLLAPDGHVLGALCVIDTVPHQEGLSPSQETGLKALARQVMAQLELRFALEELGADRQAALLRLGDELRVAPNIAAAERTAASILGQILKGSRAGYGCVDTRSGIVRIEGDWTAPGTRSLLGNHPLSVFPATIERLKQDETVAVSNVPAATWLEADMAHYKAIGCNALIKVPAMRDGELAGVLFLHSATPRTWTPKEIDFAHAIADRTYAAVAKLGAEEEQKLLNQELSHRLKNTLAMVTAIASQTLRQVKEQNAVEAFTKRILALSKAHDVLLMQSWSAASIKETIESVLGLHHNVDRFQLEGPDFNLGPKAVLSLSLLLHELATNAAKYGAFTSETGKVYLRWSITPAAEPIFTLYWEERGGPPAHEPVSKSFGSRVIGMGLVGTGNAETQFRPEGLIATFETPLASMTQGETPSH